MLTKRRHLILLIILSLGIFFLILFKTVYYAGTDEIYIQNLPPDRQGTGTETPKDDEARPNTLSIPQIGVNADIELVGITAAGNMATPRNFGDVGWYKFGVLPGEIGSAVIAGHVNNRLSLPAVFARLDELRPGDDIYVTNVSGEKLHFRVTERSVYDFNANVPEIFNQDDGKYLKLITCAGSWQQDLKTHDKRLVVTAELVE